VEGPLDNCRKRLAWAGLQREVFGAACRVYINSKPYEYVTEDNQDSGERIWKLKVLRPPDIDLRLMAGDCLHNLRATLDNAAWALAKLKKDPPPAGTAFVIAKDKDGFQGKRRDLAGLPTAVAKKIEELQPYEVLPEMPEFNSLWVLNRLWNDDKHRASPLVIFGGSIDQADAGFWGEGLPPGTIFNLGSFKDGDEVAAVPLPPHQPKPEEEPKLAFDIAFSERVPARL
jgi:hypothetical protein